MDELKTWKFICFNSHFKYLIFENIKQFFGLSLCIESNNQHFYAIKINKLNAGHVIFCFLYFFNWMLQLHRQNQFVINFHFINLKNNNKMYPPCVRFHISINLHVTVIVIGEVNPSITTHRLYTFLNSHIHQLENIITKKNT